MRLQYALKAILTAGTACIILSGLSGCASGQADLNTPGSRAAGSRTGIYLPKPENDSQIILFNRFIQKLITYDTKKPGIVQQSNVPNYMQYEFNTPSEYFTAGHNFDFGFKVLRVTPSGIEKILNLADNTGFFPLATDGKRTFFIMTHYGSSGRQERAVVVSLEEGNRLKEYPKTEGAISWGALLNGRLYYTAYEASKSSFNLYLLDYSDVLAEPFLVEQGLKSGEIYAHAGRLYRSDKNSIYFGDDAFKKASLNYFYDQHGVLIQMYVGKEGDLVLDVVDTASKKVRATFRNVVDFSVVGNELLIYRESAIDRITFKGDQ